MKKNVKLCNFMYSYTCINPLEFKIMGIQNDGYLYDRFELAPDD